MSTIAALPFAAFAQSSTSSSQQTDPNRSQSAQSTQQQQDQSQSTWDRGSQADRSSTSGSLNQSSSSMDQSSATGSMHSSTSMSGSLQVQHVTEDSLNQIVTAKDLLGKDVYGSDGEKIGSIDDIALSQSALQTVASQIISWKSEQNGGMVAGSTGESDTDSAVDSRDRDAASSGYTAGTTTGSTGAGTTVPDSNVSDPTRSASGSTAGSSSTDFGSTSTGASTDTSASGSMTSGTLASGTSSMDTSSAVSSFGSQDGPAVLVSTGGLFSRDSGKYRVPVSQLTWDAENERFTVQSTKAEFEQRNGSADSQTRR